MSLYSQRIELTDPQGRHHELSLDFKWNAAHAEATLSYDAGPLTQSRMTLISIPVDYEPPNQYDQGHVDIGRDDIEIAVAELRGIGLGTLVMRLVIDWIHEYAKPVPVATIFLSGDHARTHAERDRRNRFYEKFGFQFEYHDDGTWGESKNMSSDKLLCPPIKMRPGWAIKHIGGTDMLELIDDPA